MWRRKLQQPLHTDSLVDPRGRALLYAVWGDDQVIRYVEVSSLIDGGRRPVYRAMSRLFVGRFPAVDKALEGDPDLLVGRTFRSKDVDSLQNRLLVLRGVPRWLVPRELWDSIKDWSGPLTIECYDYDGVDEEACIAAFSFSVEVSPSSRHLPEREWWGLELVWRLAGRRDRLTHYLLTTDQPEGSDWLVLFVAVLAGAISAAIKTIQLYRLVARLADRHDA